MAKTVPQHDPAITRPTTSAPGTTRPATTPGRWARRTLGGLGLLAVAALVSCSTVDQARVVSYDTVPEGLGTADSFDRFDADDFPVPEDSAPGGTADRDAFQVPNGPGPTLGDHWHAAYSVAVCGTYLDPFSDAGPDTSGIHTHADGIIHIHPFTTAFTREGADLAAFGQAIGATFGPTSITLPDGQVLDASGQCDGQPAKLVVAVGDADALEVRPMVYTGGFGTIELDRDRMVISIALIPEGDDPPLPWSIGVLDQLTDVAPS